jgi:hypothetical protein
VPYASAGSGSGSGSGGTGTKLSAEQELLVIETWGRLVHGKVLKEGRQGAQGTVTNRSQIGHKSVTPPAVSSEPEPEPEPAPEVAVEEEAGLERFEDTADSAAAPTSNMVAGSTPDCHHKPEQAQLSRKTDAKKKHEVDSDEDDVVTATATATSPIMSHAEAAGVLAGGTPSPPRDEGAAARAALVVGASMVALVAQPIRRTDKMRHGAKHVVGQLDEGELFVIVAVHDRRPSANVGDDDAPPSASAASPSSSPSSSAASLAEMVLEIRSDDLAAGEKTGFLRHLYIKMNILPRQARDKHRESTQQKPVLLQSRQWLTIPHPYRDSFVRPTARYAHMQVLVLVLGFIHVHVHVQSTAWLDC